MKNLELKKGETQKITLLEIKTQTKKDGKIYNCFFSGTLEEAKEKASWISERILVSAEPREIEVSWTKYQKDYIDVDGFLKTDDFQQNPNDDEMMAIKPSDVAEMEGNEENAEFLKSIGR